MTSRANLTRPAPLSPGGRVAVLAISSPSTPDRIGLAADHLRSKGLDVDLAPNLYQRVHGYLAGHDEERLDSINRALRDPSYDAFLFARGGYGAMRILHAIDYDAIRARPRPIIGYSDITALHQAVAMRAGVMSFHGPMLNVDFHDGLSPDMDRWFWSMLRGDASLEYHFKDDQVITTGRAEGILFGGCLSLTAALTATPYDYWIDDGIWFWEDVSEATYRIDRMLTHLRLSGRFRNIRGVMIGKLKECGERDASELDSLLSSFFADLDIPVVRDLPFGHHADNLLMPIGARVELDTSKLSLRFPEPVVDVTLSRGKTR